MGCYFYLNEIKEDSNQIQFKDNTEYTKKIFQAYKSIKDMIKIIKQANTVSIDAYLIRKKSINNFINLLINSNILNKINEDNDLIIKAETDLKKILKDYKKEKIEILDCENITNNNNEEFIIVNDKFINSMGISLTNSVNSIKNKKVEIKIDNKRKNLNYIKVNKEKIYFKENNFGIFQFCNKNETHIMNSKNSSSIIASSNNNILNSINSRTNIKEPSNEEFFIDNLTSKIVNVIESKELSEKNK